MTKLIAAIGGFFGIIAIFVLISLLLIKVGWSLFMVPVFGMTELTWLQALGFALLAGVFRSPVQRGSK